MADPLPVKVRARSGPSAAGHTAVPQAGQTVAGRAWRTSPNRR